MRGAVLAFALALAQIATASTFEDAEAAVKQGRHRDAVEMLEPMAKEGNPRAQGLLGMLALQGLGVRKDVDEGVRLLRLSADAGNPGAADGHIADLNPTGKNIHYPGVSQNQVGGGFPFSYRD